MVVATRDRSESLHATLAALASAVTSADDIVVVDSASSDDRTRLVAEGAGARYLRCDVPGVSIARNRGARVARGQVIAFTDDDCRPRPGWVDALAAPYAAPEVGLVTGSVVGAGGGSAADTSHASAVRWRWPADPAEMGSGASMSVRRSAFEDVGGFDERLGPGSSVAAAEDHELFLRLLWAGWTATVAPTAVVDHHDRRSRWQTLRLFYAYGIGAGTVSGMCRSLDPHHARVLLWRRLWRNGIRLTVVDLAKGWKEASARAAVMTAGTVVGRARGRNLRCQPVMRCAAPRVESPPTDG